MANTNRASVIPSSGFGGSENLKLTFVLDALGNLSLYVVDSQQGDSITSGNPLATGSIPISVDPSTNDVPLARGVVIDLNQNATKQAIYTVPATLPDGRTVQYCVPSGITERQPSAAIGTAAGAAGFNAAGNDVIAADDPTTLTVLKNGRNVPADDPFVCGVPGDVFGYKVGTAEGSPATILVDFHGQLIPARID